MTGLAFEPAIATDARGMIIDALTQVEADHGVRILFAIESGSRAWGFPSPDSDYDVRFVYTHPLDWYLSLQPGRDVIELPISGDLDINGWDLRKALNLLLKPNPVMLEWLSSPIRYVWRDTAAAELTALADKTAHGPACLHHYLNLGEAQWRKHIAGKTEVNYKKYFYALRPAMAIRWVRLNPDAPPPMNIQTMAARLDLAPQTARAIADLVAMKAQARETGEGGRIAELDALIEAEFDWARQQTPKSVKPDLAGEADALFRRLVREGAP
ncbi:MAG: nucleotidyltransferase domain-containing protein [Pseudomonadota bacterium]